ncbi:VOC family protein [Hydrogenophaga sp.]|jgi:catechol 2,3-dioxygenase-like lactoylglutathione lyase family enzyme|uniref:VOC family protein n=1 Tax=Hydrogenophaga sp. TaxID=1904254 RepID=UPI003F7143E8
MQVRITVITLGVDNLERAVAFYRDGLGLPTQGIIGSEFENGAVAFFDLQDRLKLAVWPRTSIAADTGLALGARGSLEFTIGHNVSSKEEVDALLRQAIAAGATQVKAPADTFWGGYAAYFMDPDGHLWEAVYNPQMLP